LLDMVKGRLRFELRLTCLGGMHILKKIRDNDCDVFHRRPTITKRDLPALLFKTFFCFRP
ncbi:MAG: squalene synthase HpnC, partial [Gemmatimonadota bacterium]|nr:squalene synthase HpnC [Gemmatimonadota bacterium]